MRRGATVAAALLLAAGGVGAAQAAASRAPAPSADELIRRDARLSARARALEPLYQNALSRDPSGDVRREQAAALARRAACRDTACLVRWFDEREASLSRWAND